MKPISLYQLFWFIVRELSVLLSHSVCLIMANGSRIKPKFQRINVGDGAQIRCYSIVPPIWIHNRTWIRKNSNNYGLTGNLIVIFRAEIFHSGIYTCRGLTSGTTGFVATSMLKVNPSPTDRIYPKSNKVHLGRTANFRCDSDTLVCWKHQRGSLPPGACALQNNSLHIEEVKLHHWGSYTCIGQFGKDGQNFKATGELLVYDQNRVNHADIIVYKSERTTFYCLSAKKPKWLLNEKTTLPNNTFIVDLITGKSIVVINNAGVRNEGHYECFGRTDNDEQFAAKIEVKVYAVRDYYIKPGHLVAHIGENVMFICYSLVDVRWSHENNLTLPHNAMTSRNGTTSVYWIKIIAVQWNNAGKYSCVGKDYDGTYIASASLMVSKECPQGSKHGSVEVKELRDIAKSACEDRYILEGEMIRSIESLPAARNAALEWKHNYYVTQMHSPFLWSVTMYLLCI